MSASGVGILSPPLFSSNTGHRPSSPLPPHSSQSPPQSAPQSHPQPPPQSPPQPPTQSPSPPPPSISPQFPSFPPSPLYDYSSLPGGKNYFLRLICFLQHGYLFRDDPNIEHVYHSPTIHESESFILRDVKSPGYPESICKVSRLTFVKPGSAEGKSYAEEELSNYESWLMDFMMEVYILYHSSFFWFPYIVTPLKLSFVTNQPQGRKVSPALHLEFAPYGSIAHLQLTTLPLTIKDKLKLCIDAAEGLRHLHRHDVIHGDITDERFLVFDEVDFPERGKYRAKICHFSDARIASVPFPAHHFSFKPLPRWAAPEYLSGSRRHKYQDRADIWSYGLLIWKILLDGTHPYNTMLLPREVILQHKTFHRFMSLDVKRAIDHILETVREVCDDLTSEYEAGLRKLFACTLAYIPKERDLDKALHSWSACLPVHFPL